jgi:AbrB family looped-hinge helix DNA binding protein
MKIGERGQVTIPKRLRERYGLDETTEVEWIDDHGNLTLRRVTVRKAKDPWAGAVGILKKRVRDVDAEIEEMRGR